jgi:hypothetical protein
MNVAMLDLHTTERSVRAMLRRARNFDRLTSLTLVRPLCCALHEENPVAMLRKLVDLSFGASAVERRLFEMIRLCDLDATTTQEALACELGVSRRQFFRMRAQAVRAVAQRVRAVLRSVVLRGNRSIDETDVLLAGALAETEPAAALRLYATLDAQAQQRYLIPYYHARVDTGHAIARGEARDAAPEARATALALAARSQALCGYHAEAADIIAELYPMLRAETDLDARFEYESLNFFYARAHGHVHLMRSSSERMRDLALFPNYGRTLRASIETALAEADVERARGDIAALERFAFERNDVRGIAWSRLYDAVFSVHYGTFQSAEGSARIADAALSAVVPDGAVAHALLGEIALGAGKSWYAGDSVRSRPDGAWDRVLLLVWSARHLIEQGAAQAALAAASEALAIAIHQEYVPLAAMSASSAGAALDALGRVDEAQHLYAQSLFLFAPSVNVVDAARLFCMPSLRQRELGPFDSIAPVACALARRLDIAHPLEIGGAPGGDLSLQVYLETLLRFARGASVNSLMVAAQTYRQVKPHHFAHLSRHAASVARCLTVGSAFLLPKHERATYANQLRIALELSGITPAPSPLKRA